MQFKYFIGKYLSLLMVTTVYFACSQGIENKLDLYTPYRIEHVSNIHELQFGHIGNKFFILKKFRTQLDVYSADSLEETLQIVNVENFKGLEFVTKGQFVEKMISLNNNLVFLRSYPTEFHLLETSKPYNLKEFPVNIPENERISSLSGTNKNGLVFLTYNIDTLNKVKLYHYDFSSKSTLQIFQQVNEHNSGEFSLVKANLNNIHILNPYQKEMIVLDYNGKVVDEKSFILPSEFNIEFVEKRRYATMEDNMKYEKSENNHVRVADFNVKNENLFLVTIHITGHKITGRNLVQINLNDKTTFIIDSEFSPIQFDDHSNLFQFFENDSSQYIKLVSIDSLYKN